ncbi:ethylbenzene dehydrogenase-related protein [Halobellus marinus]|jgi:DMSO reductase family type II enzyme heme b subunit|uniref:ethylbenzene dehydrogenase-related protein n=1 Tax=Halobellus TaxID=1073986 RepID=UPI0028AFBA7E|nr:ethylbenzene dehydrogenase-related protein [Halobellus sp. DFY28]
MNRNERLITGLLAIVVLATVALTPAVVDARPAYEIPVYYATEGETLAAADGEEWSRAAAVTVPLGSSGSAVPSSDDVSVEQMRIEAARTESRLYLRLSWADGTRDTSADEIREFADAVAVQMPANTSSRPPIAMGGPDNRVNVWYWAADGRSEELLAGGPGTTTPYEESQVTTDATYSDGRWQVVFSRQLAAESQNRTAVPTQSDMDVALAVWNGSNMERSGQKAVSEWYYLALGPDSGGPPYEIILWTVAGIGIVVTTLVTIQGVRRTREGES